MTKATCRICGGEIRVMAFQGTGVCCERHADALAAVEALRLVVAQQDLAMRYYTPPAQTFIRAKLHDAKGD